jgi:hypothetical protein
MPFYVQIFFLFVLRQMSFVYLAPAGFKNWTWDNALLHVVNVASSSSSKKHGSESKRRHTLLLHNHVFLVDETESDDS